MATMYMPALDGALEKIEDYNQVNCIRTVVDGENKKYLIANLVGGNSVQLTKRQSFWTYPFEPVRSFSSHLGDFYCKNFLFFQDHFMINYRNLEDLKICKGREGKYAIIQASYQDGSVDTLYIIKGKRIKEETIVIENFMDKVRHLKEQEIQYKHNIMEN
jgi:hypothetical protein